MERWRLGLLIWPWERKKLVSEELAETLEELFQYFELDSEEWPMLPVYSGGEFVHGVIDDELYRILTELKELKVELEDNDD